MSWTDQEENDLKELWNKGELSATEMMAFLPGKTRNSILGKANRLNLPSKRTDRKLGRPIERKPIIVKPPTIPKPVEPPLTVPTEPWVPFMAANLRTCRAVMVQHGVDNKAMFCSNTKDIKASFCQYHTNIYYNYDQRKLA